MMKRVRKKSGAALGEDIMSEDTKALIEILKRIGEDPKKEILVLYCDENELSIAALSPSYSNLVLLLTREKFKVAFQEIVIFLFLCFGYKYHNVKN